MRPEPHPSLIVEAPVCPRCGYDQQGAIAAWTDACPIAGICSECGYVFEWSDVVRPERQRLHGFFEHERGVVRSWTSAMRTLGWVLLPWVFWSKVRPHHEVKVRRAVLWLAVWLGSMWMLIAVMRIAAYLVTPWTRRSWTFQQDCLLLTNAVLYPFASVGLVRTNPGPNTRWQTYFWWMVPEWSPIFYGLLAFGALPALALLMLSATRAGAKVRAAHVVRAGIHGQAWLALHLALLLAMALHGFVVRDFNVALGASGWLLDTWVASLPVYVLALIVWVAAWWWWAMARGFAIERPTLHWALVMIPALLVLGILGALDPVVGEWLM